MVLGIGGGAVGSGDLPSDEMIVGCASRREPPSRSRGEIHRVGQRPLEPSRFADSPIPACDRRGAKLRVGERAVEQDDLSLIRIVRFDDQGRRRLEPTRRISHIVSSKVPYNPPYCQPLIS